MGDGFAFVHERICKVTYEAVLGVRRRTLHAAVGTALEHLHGAQLETVYDRLAYHYLHADDAAKAAEYNLHLQRFIHCKLVILRSQKARLCIIRTRSRQSVRRV